jgi:alkylhydroperoxidase/carboxymuconolactone decarboxylase family protein YurZ
MCPRSATQVRPQDARPLKPIAGPKLAAAAFEPNPVAEPTAPLAQKDRALFRLALALGAGLKFEVSSFTLAALAAGWTAEELRYATLVATETLTTTKVTEARLWVEGILRKN